MHLPLIKTNGLKISPQIKFIPYPNTGIYSLFISAFAHALAEPILPAKDEAKLPLNDDESLKLVLNDDANRYEVVYDVAYDVI